ncbi:carbamoyltransferase HypF [Ideonella azotifigens]|uniref:Hydrogenase maturation protein HypF n=2 Tax=Ideonella azotifigens TaxID=513160 RepID=A0ABN1JVZ5_9BURK|nr:carbamoyltransferase HypF [Ideonella azotifigens]MCD2343210.1 carbamoyltransferase HypF [Ideonella azotifigens]
MDHAAFTHLPDVLALGAWLKNAACRLSAGEPRFSAVHGDLGDPQACIALEASVAALLNDTPRRVTAIAHDLHPDFFSTRLALRLAAELGVPAIGVQHHHAHIAAVMAEHRLQQPVIGLALDGVGLGSDGQAWGGELLHVHAQGFRRLGHLYPLGLPGGDVAAREPWRMAASALHALGRADEIEARFAAAVGAASAKGVRQMLDKRVQCPPTSSTGRWFDAAAAALGLSLKQTQEAEAAIALEQAATRWLGTGHEPRVGSTAPTVDARGVLDLRPLLAPLFDVPPTATDEAAAGFHTSLAAALAGWAASAAEHFDIGTVCLGGGCFFNAVLTTHLTQHLERRGLRVLRPLRHSCGDAGLALGQAWVAVHQLRVATDSACLNESSSCASPSQPS